MALTIPQDTTGDFPPGTWRAIKRDGVKAANLSCPKCGFRAGVGQGTNHEIAMDGTVIPSVVCDGEGCDFHEFVRLRDWEP